MTPTNYLNMKSLIQKAVILLMVALLQQCTYSQNSSKKQSSYMDNKNANGIYSHSDSSKVNLSDDEWKKILPEDVYYIARMKGTERPWSSAYETSKDIG